MKTDNELIEFRWLNVDNSEFVTRGQLDRYAVKFPRGQWRCYADRPLKNGILMAYGRRPYSRQEMITLGKKIRKVK